MHRHTGIRRQRLRRPPSDQPSSPKSGPRSEQWLCIVSSGACALQVDMNVCSEVVACCLHALLSLTMLATLTQLEPLVYTKPEDEYFHKHCTWSFTTATPKVLQGHLRRCIVTCHGCGCTVWARALLLLVFTIPTAHPLAGGTVCGGFDTAAPGHACDYGASCYSPQRDGPSRWQCRC